MLCYTIKKPLCHGGDMKHIRLIKSAISVQIIISAAYIVSGIICYALSPSLKSSAPLIYIAGLVSLWTGIASMLLALAAYATNRTGLNKDGSARPFACSQILFVATTAVYIGAWFTVYVALIKFIFVLKASAWWDRALFVLFFLPPAAVMALLTACMFFYYKENLSVTGIDLPVNPYSARNRTVAKLKVICVAVEAVAAAAYYCFIAIMGSCL